METSLEDELASGTHPSGDLAKSCRRSERRALRKALVAIETERVEEEGVRTSTRASHKKK